MLGGHSRQVNKGRILLWKPRIFTESPFDAVSMTSPLRAERRHATSGLLRPQSAARLRGAPSPPRRGGRGLHSTNIMFSLMSRGPNSGAFVCVRTGLTGCSSAAEAGGASGSCGAAVGTSLKGGARCTPLACGLTRMLTPQPPDSPFLFSL